MPPHGRLMKRLDRWVRSIESSYANQMHCVRGCTKCCYGLCDISLPDALRIVEGLNSLTDDLKKAAISRALEIHAKIVRECPELREPYFLGEVAEDKIDAILESIGEVRCPLLSEDDVCLIYEYRPLECILEGIPMVDAQDGLFGDWCDLNFKEGISSAAINDLRLDYYEIQAIEQDVTAYISLYFPMDLKRDNTIFIPSVFAAIGVFRDLRVKAFKP
jgi:hypothetical protein